MAMNNTLVVVESLTKQFNKTKAICDISFSVNAGDILGVIGPDGAGKTTLMRLLTGLLIPTQGCIRVCGYDTQTQPLFVQGSIGYMPQKFGLYEDLTVAENLNLYLELRQVPKENQTKTLERILYFTQLAAFKKRLARNLSGGMKQKLGLGCALINKPRVLLLDEPSVGVDPISRKELWQMVYELIQDDITVIWSTSYLDEAERCKQVIVLNEGRIIYQGKPFDLTKTVSESVYLITPAAKDKRSTLLKIIENPNVIDCTITGNQLRLVMQKGQDPKFLNFKLPNYKLTEPRFEDAFMTELGGIKERQSVLATYYKIAPTFKETAISAHQLTKKFGDFVAANNITLHVQPGEIFGLLGPNGAGKSTIFKMLCGLLKPTQGTATVVGFDLGKTPSQARIQIGYMAQKFSLYNELSAIQNLQFFSGIYGLHGKQQKDAITIMVDTFELSSMLDNTTATLPLGYKQRLALSCALMHKPPLLFLDEPTSGVDPLIRREFWLHINNIVTKGTTVMVTTHFMEEAEYCDRLALIYNGNIIAFGTPDDLKNQVPSDVIPNPKMEDAFIYLIENYQPRRSNNDATI